MLAFLCHLNLAGVRQVKWFSSLDLCSYSLAHSVPVSPSAGASPPLECVHTEERRINSYLYPQNMLLSCKRELHVLYVYSII